MSTIEPHPVQALGQLMRGRFGDAEIARVRRERPEQAARVDDDRIRSFIEHAIARAAACELRAVSEVQRFIDLSFRLGPDFEQRSDAQRCAGGVRAARSARCRACCAWTGWTGCSKRAQAERLTPSRSGARDKGPRRLMAPRPAT